MAKLLEPNSSINDKALCTTDAKVWVEKYDIFGLGWHACKKYINMCSREYSIREIRARGLAWRQALVAAILRSNRAEGRLNYFDSPRTIFDIDVSTTTTTTIYLLLMRDAGFYTSHAVSLCRPW